MSHNDHLTVPKVVEVPSEQQQQRLRERGVETDTLGRPLHPWRNQLPNLHASKGELWNWGPNDTVDPIVITSDDDPRLLLIQRGDCGQWALPGGFVDKNEAPTAAAYREVLEETNLGLSPVMSPATICYQGAVHDRRSTLHAWPETTSVLIHTPCLPVSAADDAVDARWVRLADIRSLSGLYGSHATLIDMAIHDNGSLHEQLEYYGELSEITRPKGGHMGYTRLVASLPTGKRVFVKRHDAEKFTDATRAIHSKRYLHKEHYVYQQLAGSSPHVPQHVELSGDHTLLLEAYDPRDGWHWKAPDGSDQRRHYIEDIIGALRSLETTTYEPFQDIKPSYHTIIDEGWGSYATNREHIVARLTQSTVEGASELAQELDTLYEQAATVQAPELAYFAHYDIRQSNVTWHPERGVRIVDWSWADHAPRGMDTTSFLIDIAKAGHNIDAHLPDFNPNHALLLIGFWLGHSILPTPTDDQTVREHQISSAVAAYRLLKTVSH